LEPPFEVLAKVDNAQPESATELAYVLADTLVVHQVDASGWWCVPPTHHPTAIKNTSEYANVFLSPLSLLLSDTVSVISVFGV